MTRSTDLLVVGAGPVGLATAIEAAAAGMSVTVVDPRHGPVDKACGEGLMPGARASLERLGVTVTGSPFRGIRYTTPELGAHHEVTAHFRGGAGLGVRRLELSGALAARADQLGVRRVTGRTACTRRPAARSGWTLTSPARAGSGCDVTTRWRRGPTWSRCTGPATPRPT